MKYRARELAELDQRINKALRVEMRAADVHEESRTSRSYQALRRACERTSALYRTRAELTGHDPRQLSLFPMEDAQP